MAKTHLHSNIHPFNIFRNVRFSVIFFSVTKSARSGVSFPVGRIQRSLREGEFAKRIGTGAAVYLASVLEYLSAEILELSCEAAIASKKVRITPRHIKRVIMEDQELKELLKDVDIPFSGVMPFIHPMLMPKASKKKNQPQSSDEEEQDSGSEGVSRAEENQSEEEEKESRVEDEENEEDTSIEVDTTVES